MTKPLSNAKQRLRRDAYERRQAERYETEVRAAEDGVPLPPDSPRMTGAEYAAAARASLDKHTTDVEAIRVLFERVVARSTTANLQRLEAALSLYARSLRR